MSIFSALYEAGDTAMKLTYVYDRARFALGCNDDFSDPSEAPRFPGFRDASMAPPTSGPSTVTSNRSQQPESAKQQQ